MKELERTKRISISAVLFLLIILIGLLTFKKPEHIFHKSAANTLEVLNNKDYVLTMDQLKSLGETKYALIDIRNSYEYAKGHIKGAINITAHQVFNKETKDLFTKISNEGKIIVVYAENPDAASGAWMLLYQLGYENTKILSVTSNYIDNKLVVKNYDLEEPAVNFADVMKKALSASEKSDGTTAKKAVQKPKKKVIPKAKKKKRVPEGGC